jgi:hypothetical protein
MVCGPWYVKKPKKPINALYVKKAELSTKTQIGAAFLRGDFFPAGGSLALPRTFLQGDFFPADDSLALPPYLPSWSWAAP